MLPPKAIQKLEKRIGRLFKWRYAKVAEVPLEMAETMEHRRTPPMDLVYAHAPIGTKWGAEWLSAWFRGRVQLPEACAGKQVFYRHISFSEKLLFIDGKPFAGMNPHHEEVLITANGQPGTVYDLAIEAYSGHRFGDMDPCDPGLVFHQVCGMDPGKKPPHTLEASELLVERPQTAGLYYDAFVLFETAKCLPESSLRRAMIFDGLNAAIDLIPFQWQDEEELETASKAARAHIAPLLAEKNAATAPRVGLVGHSHIDLAWLWPFRETFRKTARTFTTFLRLFEQYPELTYLQSQPVLVELLAEHYPELLPEVQAAVKRGQWEPNGGMWTEADCNITAGESLIRQFLESRKATLERFNRESDTLWLPDVFGYSAALPQIAVGCGMKHFVTSKINWNDTTRFPYDTFLWQGLDGTELFTHFITGRVAGYSAEATPEQLWDCWNNVLLKEVQDSAICPVGYGDGGGGTTREMCELARREVDLDGCPRTSFVNLSHYLTRLREQPIRRPRWVGELYLEYHRGTYTSEGRIKRYNRKLEFLLRDIELAATMALAQGHAYPAAHLQAAWRLVLTNQCHDNIAGSCIRQTCEEMEADYAKLFTELTDLKASTLSGLGAGLAAPKSGTPVMVMNSLSWPRAGLLRLENTEWTSAYDHTGQPLAAQAYQDREDVVLLVEVPTEGLSATTIGLGHDAPDTASPFTHTDGTLDTPFYAVTFDDAGRITGLYDKKAQREVVQQGRHLNGFYSAEDMPLYWDPFDIDAYYRDVVKPEDRLQSRKILAEGPLCITFRSTYAVGRRSTLIQDMTFYARSRRIDFATEVDWHERHLLLKTGFAVDVQSTQWRNEIQFGHVLRNRHLNTAFDQARFEIYAHKWVDVSESQYGVALLNDCKYGHDCLDGMISLTLLRSVEGSNDKGDEGAHHFTYALLPHDGGFEVETVVREAYEFNVPLSAQPIDANGAQDALAFCTVSNPNVVLEWVKKAEDGAAAIVRVYEAGQSRATTALTFAVPPKSVVECDLIEREKAPVKVDGATINVTLRPFEVKTFKVTY